MLYGPAGPTPNQQADQHREGPELVAGGQAVHLASEPGGKEQTAADATGTAGEWYRWFLVSSVNAPASLGGVSCSILLREQLV